MGGAAFLNNDFQRPSLDLGASVRAADGAGESGEEKADMLSVSCEAVLKVAA